MPSSTRVAPRAASVCPSKVRARPEERVLAALHGPVGRLQSTADFERVLGTRPWARSTHFAVHHLAAVPARPSAGRASDPVANRLSTGPAPSMSEAVDDSTVPGRWLGLVVPKRHAKRAVTRNLLKRQIRAAVDQHAVNLPQGLWVVRLRAPFDRAQFVSAASAALATAARAELDALLGRRLR